MTRTRTKTRTKKTSTSSTRKRKKRMRKMRSGDSVAPKKTFLALFAIGGGLLTAGLAPAGPGQRSSGSDAVIVGTVFRDPGFALPGAEITLVPDPERPEKSPNKPKKQ